MTQLVCLLSLVTSFDHVGVVVVTQTRDIEGSEDDTYFVSAQSPMQRQLIGQKCVN